MAGAGVVYQNVEVTSFGERGVERLFDREPIGEVETNRVQLRNYWYAFQIARCAPNLVTLGYEQLGYGKADARAPTGDQDFFQDVGKGFALRDAWRVAAALIPILTVGSMQECPAQQYRYSASHDGDSSESRISILSQCCR